MNWVVLVLIGASVNALLNFSYKRLAPQLNIQIFIAVLFAVAAAMLAGYAWHTEPENVVVLFSGHTPLVLLAMGLGSSVVITMLITALVRGPITLVDPMWACVYALGSVAIGMVAAREQPGFYPVLGVAFYLVGVVLMAQGARKK